MLDKRLDCSVGSWTKSDDQSTMVCAALGLEDDDQDEVVDDGYMMFVTKEEQCGSGNGDTYGAIVQCEQV